MWDVGNAERCASAASCLIATSLSVPLTPSRRTAIGLRFAARAEEIDRRGDPFENPRLGIVPFGIAFQEDVFTLQQSPQALNEEVAHPADRGRPYLLSKDLLKRGFKFVGSAICYAFMQAVGMANDHETRCFRHSELSNFSANLCGNRRYARA